MLRGSVYPAWEPRNSGQRHVAIRARARALLLSCHPPQRREFSHSKVGSRRGRAAASIASPPPATAAPHNRSSHHYLDHELARSAADQSSPRSFLAELATGQPTKKYTRATAQVEELGRQWREKEGRWTADRQASERAGSGQVPKVDRAPALSLPLFHVHVPTYLQRT